MQLEIVSIRRLTGRSSRPLRSLGHWPQRSFNSVLASSKQCSVLLIIGSLLLGSCSPELENFFSNDESPRYYAFSVGPNFNIEDFDTPWGIISTWVPASCRGSHHIASVSIERMPSADSLDIMPQVIVEFDEHGALLNYWSVPMISRLIGISDLHVFTQDSYNFYADGKGIWYTRIHRDRTFSEVEVVYPMVVNRESTSCPSDMPMYARPGAIECWKYTDGKTNAKRTLAMTRPANCDPYKIKHRPEYFTSPLNSALGGVATDFNFDRY